MSATTSDLAKYVDETIFGNTYGQLTIAWGELTALPTADLKRFHAMLKKYDDDPAYKIDTWKNDANGVVIAWQKLR